MRGRYILLGVSSVVVCLSPGAVDLIGGGEGVTGVATGGGGGDGGITTRGTGSAIDGGISV